MLRTIVEPVARAQSFLSVIAAVTDSFMSYLAYNSEVGGENACQAKDHWSRDLLVCS